MKKPEVTTPKAATAASKTLQNSNASKSEKSAAGSALSQTKAPQKVTSSSAASSAGKALSNPGSNKSAKSAAGSALTQKPGKSK